MAAHVTRREGPAPSERELESIIRGEGLSPRWWGNGPGDAYEWHAHRYHKVLYCASGSITFHTHAEKFELHPGDRLDVEPGTEHAATVGGDGVRCVEAGR